MAERSCQFSNVTVKHMSFVKNIRAKITFVIVHCFHALFHYQIKKNK